VTRFVRALRSRDRVSLMGISNSRRVLEPLTSDLTTVGRSIGTTRAAGRMPLYVSIYTALNELDGIRAVYAVEPRRQALVVLSDEEDTASALSLDDLMPIVRRHGVRIHRIAPRSRACTYDIAGELAYQYALGYPSNRNRDGAFRRIALRIMVPGLKWRTRAGYLADREANSGY
jgi:Mg-chelatase subunit ChlD